MGSEEKLECLSKMLQNLTTTGSDYLQYVQLCMQLHDKQLLTDNEFFRAISATALFAK